MGDHRRASDPDPVVDALVQTSFAVMTVVTKASARHDLSLTLWRIIAILRDRTPRMSDLADHLQLDRSTITGIVDRAVTRGLLRKVADPNDRRANRVALTADGQRLAATCAREVDAELAPMLSRLTRPQREHLGRALTVLTAP